MNAGLVGKYLKGTRQSPAFSASEHIARFVRHGEI